MHASNELHLASMCHSVGMGCLVSASEVFGWYYSIDVSSLCGVAPACERCDYTVVITLYPCLCWWTPAHLRCRVQPACAVRSVLEQLHRVDPAQGALLQAGSTAVLAALAFLLWQQCNTKSS